MGGLLNTAPPYLLSNPKLIQELIAPRVSGPDYRGFQDLPSAAQEIFSRCNELGRQALKQMRRA